MHQDPRHHPGPPRFTAVGDAVELAPRDPNPDATYDWRLRDRPAESDAALGDDPVLWFAPDAPGVYTAELDAPDGVHRLTVRAFPAGTAPGGRTGTSGYSGQSGPVGRSGPAGASGGVGSGSGARFGEDGPGGRPRVRLRGEREDDAVVLRAEARTAPGSDRPDSSLDVEFHVDDRDDATLSVAGREARLPVPDAPVRVHAVAVGEQYSVADAVSVGTDGAVEHLNTVPEWGRSMTLYEVYVRGFLADRDPGVSVFEALGDRLPELTDLGVDTLWLTPILENDDAPHGYNITDFFAIADDLGTRAEFEAFVDRAHDHGVRVLFDLVLNHSARTHPYFERAADGDPEYRDWYAWNDDGTPESYFDWQKVANFDFRTLDVRRHLLDAVDEWAPLVDGFRCDMAWAVPRPFWQEVRERVKARDAEFLLLDETIPYVADFHELCFDVHFDTTLYFTLREVGRGNAPAGAILDSMIQRQSVGFPDHAEFMLYLENHDEVRYVEECGRAATLAAAGVWAGLPGAPMLYAGQEIGERVRRGIVHWDDADESLREHYRRLLETRAGTPALRGGAFEPVEWRAGDATDDVVAFAREADDRWVVVCHFGEGTATVTLPGESVSAVDRVTGADVGSEGGDLAVDSVVVVPAGG